MKTTDTPAFIESVQYGKKKKAKQVKPKKKVKKSK